MSNHEYMHLLQSESAIAQMAATVFAGLIQKQEFSPRNEDALVEKSVAIAIKLAVRTEKLVKSDQEWMGKEGGTGFLGS